MLKPPFIHDPGNGPRVRDARAFLESEFFAQRPALDDPLCAEFAQEEVLQMLLTVLPEEAAIILWYNKSRLTSRVCPVCQRLYRLGDVLPDHTTESDSETESESDYHPHAEKQRASPQLEREQELSGICMFPDMLILASFSHSNAIKSAWGRTADEMDDETWDLLNSPRRDTNLGKVSHALSMLVKMTRLHDLGLAQLCLGEDVEELEDVRE
ncbi:hypothetical protein BDQ17DRAFT_1238553 [Cyathus striatus]|nr:hypothetical protein BDQ17DRAFT_1238553 [Cyathus striatus]